MKILAFSDVIEWKGYKELINKTKPDVICLAGDLVSDGFARFWYKALEQIPSYQEEIKKLGNNLEDSWKIEEKYKNTEEYRKNLKRLEKIHSDKFYEFIKFAGKRSKVLVVKGDHDEKYYSREKINNIPGCREISGECVEIEGLYFLGLGYNETHYLRVLKQLIEKFKEKVDIVVTHCEQNRMPFVSLLKPKIIIRGHFGSGKYLVNGIPSVFTAFVKYTIIEMNNTKLVKIRQYIVDRNGQVKLLKKGSCKPLLSNISEFEMYKWLKPYEENRKEKIY